MPKSLITVLSALLFSLFVDAQTTQFIEHRVRWMENVYTISRKYNTDPKTILEYNRISANEVRRGITIRIPIILIESNVAQTDSLNLNDLAVTSTQEELYGCNEYRPSSGITHRASLILPFDLQKTQPNSQFIEFYQGLLLAVEDLKEEGMSATISSYDSEDYPRLSTLVQSGMLRDEELVIGPVHHQEVLEILNHTYGQNIKFISPLSRQTESAAYTNANFFQVNTPLYWQQYNLIRYLQRNSGMVWLFFEEGGADRELMNITIDILRKNGIIYREFAHKVSRDRDVAGELSQLLTQGQNNQVIVVSTDEAFVSDILRNLYFVHSRRNCPVTLYGNAEWPAFDSVELDYYHSMNLHLSVAQYIDYQNPAVKRFLARYRALYRAEPSAYAYQGYDVGYYFLRALYTKGPSFERCIEQGIILAQPLQSNFRFQKAAPDGGYINTDTRVIRYFPDYRIEVLH